MILGMVQDEGLHSADGIGMQDLGVGGGELGDGSDGDISVYSWMGKTYLYIAPPLADI